MNRPHAARYWTTDPDGRVRCELCPRFCRLRDGQRGACKVRRRSGRGMVLDAWGRTTGFAADPIEKKPLYHFLPGSATLSFGAVGCNLACRFCQNWDVSAAAGPEALTQPATPKSIARAATAHGCESVAFTYNEPSVALEFVVDVARECRERGLKTVAVTNGVLCGQPRRDLYRWIDAANVDLKAFTDDFYRRVCGGRLQTVLDTLRFLRAETDVWLEITNLVIPGENDSEEEIDAMTRWIVAELGPDVPVHFTAFYPAWRMTDRPRTPIETLRRAREIARRNGIHHAYTGNVLDAEGSATLCPACGAELVARRGLSIARWRMAPGGRCDRCGTRCAGVFEEQPGRWTAQCVPVRVSPRA